MEERRSRRSRNQIEEEVIDHIEPEEEHTYVSSMLCDSHNNKVLSSKRVITLLAFVFCSIAFFANLFFEKDMSPFIYETMAWIVLAGFGSTAVEKFTRK
jgi:hypothetical protein